MLKKISLSTMIFTYLIAGVVHFKRTDYFVALIPPFIPSPHAFVLLAGTIYILLSLFLAFPKTRRGACYAILFLLAVSIPLNCYMLFSDAARGQVPREIVLERIPFDMVLMLWAFWHSR